MFAKMIGRKGELKQAIETTTWLFVYVLKGMSPV